MSVAVMCRGGFCCLWDLFPTCGRKTIAPTPGSVGSRCGDVDSISVVGSRCGDVDSISVVQRETMGGLDLSGLTNHQPCRRGKVISSAEFQRGVHLSPLECRVCPNALARHLLSRRLSFEARYLSPGRAQSISYEARLALKTTPSARHDGG